MTKYCIVLGHGRRIGVGKYVIAWKRCRELPPETWIGRGVSGWGETAGDALHELRKGLHDRINRNIPGYGVGRKWSDDWYCPIWRASRDLNNPRLIIDWLPADLKARFSYRLREAA